MNERYEIKNLGNGSVAVFTPYNATFVGRIKKLSGARWNAGMKAWTVSEAAEEASREIMREVYGRDDRPTETVTVRIRAKEEYSLWHEPVILWGKTLSSASGRDSGARSGDSVSLVVGKISSGGSVKNWRSVVNEGAEFILENVPATSIADVPEWVEVISVQKNGIDIEALHEERARLMARIAEIDALLGGN